MPFFRFLPETARRILAALGVGAASRAALRKPEGLRRSARVRAERATRAERKDGESVRASHSAARRPALVGSMHAPAVGSIFNGSYFLGGCE
jgi:hypothetical protein